MWGELAPPTCPPKSACAIYLEDPVVTGPSARSRW